MVHNRLFLGYAVLVTMLCVNLLTGCGIRSMEGKIILTESKSIRGNRDFVTGEGWRYIDQSRIIAIDKENHGKNPEILTSDFYSARSPEVSYDGSHLLFTGKKSQDDSWQIWEMDLGNLKYRQVTNSSDNSTDPAYLPGGRMVFSRSIQGDSLRAGHALFTCNLDGTDLKRITFNPHTYFASSVLMDGRIIAASRQLYPSVEKPALMVIRPDGTKAELFYKGEAGNELLCRGWETDNGKIVFIETNMANEGKVVAVNYNRPLHSRIELTGTSEGNYLSVSQEKKGNLLVSFRADNEESYSLYEFDLEKLVPGKKIYSSELGDVIEAVEVTVHERPRKLPSEVDMGVKTGLVLCQNINVTGMTSPETGFALPAADRIEVIGIDSSMGVVEVENDGSVYLKVAADKPFRIRTMDKHGNTVNGPGGWYWLRPNERRGCVGCNEDQEMVPANRYAVAVSKDPVTIPVHYTGIMEKKVELE